jgi:hypothetical protein
MLTIKKLGKREKILAITVAALLLAFVFKLLIFNPLLEKTSSAKLQIERAQLGIRKYLELVQQKEDILKAEKQIERYLNLKGTDEEKMGAILSKIESEARKAGLSILDMNPQPMAKTKSIPLIYRVQLRAEADISKLFDFIYSLENSDILFKIERLNLSVKDESLGVIKIELSILAVSLL